MVWSPTILPYPLLTWSGLLPYPLLTWSGLLPSYHTPYFHGLVFYYSTIPPTSMVWSPTILPYPLLPWSGLLPSYHNPYFHGLVSYHPTILPTYMVWSPTILPYLLIPPSGLLPFYHTPILECILYVEIVKCISKIILNVVRLRVEAATKLQAHWRGYSVRHYIKERTRAYMTADTPGQPSVRERTKADTSGQASVRHSYESMETAQDQQIINKRKKQIERWDKAAVKIQVNYGL